MRTQVGFVPRAIRSVVPKITKPILRKRGFSDVNILADWPEIVGPKWAEVTSPEKLRLKPKGTLYLQLDSGGTAVLLKHIEVEIIDRVNTYFGYKAVQQLKFIQSGITKKPSKPNKKTPKAILSDFQGQEEIQDEHLREALSKLHNALN